jgi:hypothetical protein
MMRQYRAIDNVEENREDWTSWKRDQHAFKYNIIIKYLVDMARPGEYQGY